MPLARRCPAIPAEKTQAHADDDELANQPQGDGRSLGLNEDEEEGARHRETKTCHDRPNVLTLSLLMQPRPQQEVHESEHGGDPNEHHSPRRYAPPVPRPVPKRSSTGRTEVPLGTTSFRSGCGTAAAPSDQVGVDGGVPTRHHPRHGERPQPRQPRASGFALDRDRQSTLRLRRLHREPGGWPDGTRRSPTIPPLGVDAARYMVDRCSRPDDPSATTLTRTEVPVAGAPRRRLRATVTARDFQFGSLRALKTRQQVLS